MTSFPTSATFSPFRSPAGVGNTFSGRAGRPKEEDMKTYIILYTFAIVTFVLAYKAVFALAGRSWS